MSKNKRAEAKKAPASENKTARQKRWQSRRAGSTVINQISQEE